MSEITLFIAPGSCSRVSMIALEEAGVAFESRVIRFMAGEHKTAEFKALNPKSKIPLLVIDGEALSENVAIIVHLNALYPQAGLLPPTKTSLEAARQIADLCFCSATLHPLVTRIRMPQIFAGMEIAARVREVGSQAMTEAFAIIESRLAGYSWWYGETWSAVDAYLYWVFWRVEDAGFDVSAFPNFARHARANEVRPAVQRALAREIEADAILAAEGLQFRPPPIPPLAPAVVS